MSRFLPYAFVMFVPCVFACGSAGGEPGAVEAAPQVCSETNLTEKRIAFVEGEITALAVTNGEVLAGAKSLRIGEEGAVWRVPFDGRPSEMVSPRYVRGPVHASAGSVVHSEPTEDPNRGRVVVTAVDGSGRRVVDGPSVLLGELEIVSGRLFWFGIEGQDHALWSYDPAQPDAKVARVAGAVDGALFSSGKDLFRFAIAGEGLVEVRRLDAASGGFLPVTSFEPHARTVAGADGGHVYLFDAAARAIVSVDIATGNEVGTLGHDIDGIQSGMHVTGDAIYAADADEHLVRIDKATGEQEAIADLGAAPVVHAWASDACYVYASIEGARTVARFPRRP